MIGWLVFAAYAMVATASLRPFYGRFRAMAIDSGVRSHPVLYGDDAVGEFDNLDRGMVRLAAGFASALWPLGWFGLFAFPVIGRYMDGSSVRSRYETDKERDAMARRIADLERELNIR